MNPHVGRMFGSLEFVKTTAELLPAFERKTLALRAKIEERIGRIDRMRKDYDIDDAALIAVLQETAHRLKNDDGRGAFGSTISYRVSNAGVPGAGDEERVIGVGVCKGLLSEQESLASERESADRLDLIVRNLKPIAAYSEDGTLLPHLGFHLTFDELLFLGF
jgi:hypothetical protein